MILKKKNSLRKLLDTQIYRHKRGHAISQCEVLVGNSHVEVFKRAVQISTTIIIELFRRIGAFRVS